MVKRRVLLPSLVAIFVLLGPGQALAAPTWLSGESQDGAQAADSVPVDVATDSGGNSVAVWAANTGTAGEVRAAYRPRGGLWGAPQSLDGEFAALPIQPRVAVQPNGEFVAVWLANNDGNVLRWARRPAGGGWSGADTIGRVGCCIAALLASADGTVTTIVDGTTSASSFTKAPGADAFGAGEAVPNSSDFAAASDGSVVAVRSGSICAGATLCVVARRRPPGGPWPTGDELVAGVSATLVVSGLAVTANPGASYTAVWAESSGSASLPSGSVRSSDRGAGDAGAWAASKLVANVPSQRPGCGGSCVDVATGAGGGQLALWKQGGVMSAALRGGAGSAWGATETAGASPGASQPYGAITTGGVPVAAWDSGGQTGDVTGTHREGGTWHPVEILSGPARGRLPGVTFLGDLAADGQGDALTAWRQDSGVQTAGFDATGPRFTAFSLPAGGSAASPLPFTAAADDNWSGPPALSWRFGDGGTASGGSVSHSYAAGGSYVATASAADGAGNVTERSGPVGVATAPCAAGGTGDADKDGIVDGCDTNNGAERPKPFKTVNATVISGEVFVKLPAGAGAARATARKAPKGFKRLLGAETIPVGATLDTAHGRVKVRSAADTKAKKLQSGQFFRGRFSIRQARIKKRSKKLITELRLTGSSFKKACKAKAKASISAKRKKKSKKRVRRLFGNAKGSFRTSGRNAAATVRGTRWSVQDRCDGTLVTVQRGRVEVRDKVKRKTVIVRTGHTYLARAR